MNNREANQSSFRAVPKLSVIISASVSIRRREQRTHLRNNGAASSEDPVASARIGSVVVPIIVVGRQTQTFSQTQPVTSSSTFQSLSGVLYKTTRTDLNKHVRGVCNPSKGIVNVESIAMFTASFLRQKDVPTKRLTASRRYPGCICNPDRVKKLVREVPHQETSPATRTEQKMQGRLCGQHLESKTEASSLRCAFNHRPRVLRLEGKENALRDRRDSLANHEDRQRENRRNQKNLGKGPPARTAAKSHLTSRSKSTSVKTNPASRSARDHNVRQRAVFFEKCQASTGPDGPRGTETTGRRQRSGCLGTIAEACFFAGLERTHAHPGRHSETQHSGRPWCVTRSHRKRQRQRDHLSGQVFARRESTRLSQSQIGMRKRRYKLTEKRRQVCLWFELGSAVSSKIPLHNLVGLAVVVYMYKARERRCML